MGQERVKLEDVLNYKPEFYLSDEEMDLIKFHFRGNDKLLKVIRKLMIPTIADPELPLENMQNDVLLAGYNWAQIPDMEIKSIILARQDALQFIIGGLIKLKQFAYREEAPDPVAVKKKRDKDDGE